MVLQRKEKIATFLALIVIVAICLYPVAGWWVEPDVKNTSEEYPLYQQNDVSIQLPVMFTLNHDLVSDDTDTQGYCMSVVNRDVECYTMKGRFLGVGDVHTFYNGDKSAVHVYDKAPDDYRQALTNAFFRVWG